MIAAELSSGWIGVAAAVVIAAGGWIISLRTAKTDTPMTMLNSALAIADRHASDEHECREQLAKVNARVDAVVEDLAECHDRHARAEAAMTAAGINLID